MSDTKTPFVRLDFIAIGVFAIIFLMWSVRQCRSKQQELQEAEQAAAASTTTAPAPVAPATTAPAPVAPATTAPAPAVAPAAPSPAITGNGETVLYVSIDSLRLRRGPDKDSATVAFLLLDEPVYFTGNRSPKTQKIKIAGTLYNEPWLQVRTVKDRKGWVYGAGVRPYRTRQ